MYKCGPEGKGSSRSAWFGEQHGSLAPLLPSPPRLVNDRERFLTRSPDQGVPHLGKHTNPFSSASLSSGNGKSGTHKDDTILRKCKEHVRGRCFRLKACIAPSSKKYLVVENNQKCIVLEINTHAFSLISPTFLWTLFPPTLSSSFEFYSSPTLTQALPEFVLLPSQNFIL